MGLYLPIVANADHYSQLFPQNSLWEPAILHLAKKHKLPGEPRRASTGSHIVYRVGDYWIKLMAPLFAKDIAFEVGGLNSIKGRVSVAVPLILAQGVLEGWSYIILSHVTGDRVGEVWPGLSPSQKTDLARHIGQITLELQACAADPVLKLRGDWTEFIRSRLRDVVAHHQSKKMDPLWLAGLPAFMGRFKEEEFVGDKEVFLHADLTRDHFLVGQRDGRPVVSGVIDLADCRVGLSEYDIPATAAFIFMKEPASLREYLQGLGYKEDQLNQRMSEKLMAWTCLHLYSDLKNYFSHDTPLHTPGDFASLAYSVFP